MGSASEGHWERRADYKSQLCFCQQCKILRLKQTIIDVTDLIWCFGHVWPGRGGWVCTPEPEANLWDNDMRGTLVWSGPQNALDGEQGSRPGGRVRVNIGE